MNIPILGIPLLYHSFRNNGMADSARLMQAGVAPLNAIEQGFVLSKLANNPIAYIIQEKIKWGIYKKVNLGTLISFGDLKFKE